MSTLATLPLGSRVVYRGTTYVLLTRDLFGPLAYLCQPGGAGEIKAPKSDIAAPEALYI
jgi:hypothetical protein